MLTTIRSSLALGQARLRRLATDPTVHAVLRTAAYLLSGFFLSAASLGHYAQPFTMGLVLALEGVPAVLTALGGGVGYLVFWGRAGLPGVLWTLSALGLGLVLRPKRQLTLSMLAGTVCAVAGLLLREPTPAPFPMHLLRIALAMGAAALFRELRERRDSIAAWLTCGVAVLALAQVAPLPVLCLGYPVAAALTVWGAFPAAAMAGLALDLALVSPVSMTAVLSLAWFSRFALDKGWLRALAPAALYPVVMALTGTGPELSPLPGLLLGGLVGLVIPSGQGYTPRRGEVGVAQVRLELASSVLRQLEQQLLELPLPTVDGHALLQKACDRACGSCASRRNCPGRAQARALQPEALTELPETLPFCRRSGRLLQELRRSGEHLRLLRSGQARNREYRTAMVRQYRFLSEYLQSLSDDLARRGERADPRYRVEVHFCGNRRREDNGDRCLSFHGPQCRYYVALVDGMGTGLGAVDEGRTAGETLRQLLCAGFPAEQVLMMLNTLCALRDRAGAVTVDLAEVQLDTGRVQLYKWGAAPSWRVTERGCEKIGTAGPPPGLSVADEPEAAHRLSLRRGELLAMLSDGAGGEDALRRAITDVTEPLDAIAERILEKDAPGRDDATVALIRLTPTA